MYYFPHIYPIFPMNTFPLHHTGITLSHTAGFQAGCPPDIFDLLYFIYVAKEPKQALPAYLDSAFKPLCVLTLFYSNVELYSPLHTACFSCRYFSFVAIPPLICRSDLFKSSTTLALPAKIGLICRRRSVTSACVKLISKKIIFSIFQLFLIAK